MEADVSGDERCATKHSRALDDNDDDAIASSIVTTISSIHQAIKLVHPKVEFSDPQMHTGFPFPLSAPDP